MYEERTWDTVQLVLHPAADDSDYVAWAVIRYHHRGGRKVGEVVRRGSLHLGSGALLGEGALEALAAVAHRWAGCERE